MMRRIKGNGADGEDDLRDGFSVAAQPAASPLDSIVGVAAVAGAADEDEHDDSDDEVHSEQPLSAPAGAAVSAAATSKEDKESMSTAKIPFPWKLHTLLERASDEDFEDIVSWEAGGKAFRVHKPKEFCDTIMPKYFRQSKFESFTRQCEYSCALYGRSSWNVFAHLTTFFLLFQCISTASPKSKRRDPRKAPFRILTF
jgi:hypothetical protein